jgi:hypothetical protein
MNKIYLKNNNSKIRSFEQIQNKTLVNKVRIFTYALIPVNHETMICRLTGTPFSDSHLKGQ